MNFLETSELAQNFDFRTRVKMASMKAAGDILADPSQDMYKRLFSQLIVAEPDNSAWLTTIVYQVVQNPAITPESTDSDIQFTVNSVFEKVVKSYYRVVDNENPA